MTQSLVVGVDAGATSSRVAVHTLDGTRVGYGRAGAGNPSAHGMDKAVSAIATALREALPAGSGPQVVASLAGVAGFVDEMRPRLAEIWAAQGIAEGPRLYGDVTIAYAAGSAEPDGSLLLSGTGAAAARMVGYELDAVADALGWLLGDAGSGFWIGRRAAKAVIEALDRGMPVEFLFTSTGDTGSGGPVSGGSLDSGSGSVGSGPVSSGPVGSGSELARLIGGNFLGEERPETPRAAASRIVRLAQADHMRLAALAPLVSQAAMAGDPTAIKIVNEAADHLVATLRRVHVTGPVVLAGSVLTSEGPVRRAVSELLEGERVLTAGDAASGAAWLAARPLLPEADAKARHATFTG